MSYAYDASHITRKQNIANLHCLSDNLPMQKKTATVSTRIPPALRQRLDTIHRRHLTNDSAVTLSLLEAFCEHIETTGKVEFPIRISPATTAIAELTTRTALRKPA